MEFAGGFVFAVPYQLHDPHTHLGGNIGCGQDAAGAAQGQSAVKGAGGSNEHIEIFVD